MFIHTIKLLLIVFLFACTNKETKTEVVEDSILRVGAERMDLYLEKLEGKNIALCINQTSMVDNTPLYDTLKSLGVNIPVVFTPEHGFKGTADAGEKVDDDQIDKTEIISLYGKQKKPLPEHLKNIDLVIFDIQDAGARFYTYISTMHYLMEACAENNKPILILDRPNPNGHYVDGPVLDTAYRSFVGMHPIPIVHGMTVGELAKMINGEGWMKNGITCDVEVIKVSNWTHETHYSLPVKPSPNLPNERSINLYPSLCLFEGTVVSIGRGTAMPFQVIGHPNYTETDFSFTPFSTIGATYPKFENTKCYGIDLREGEYLNELRLTYLIKFYENLKDKEVNFFNAYFTLLAGNSALQKQIEDGWSEDQIRNSWQDELNEFKTKREKYLLYP